jgi:hypothetical protein
MLSAGTADAAEHDFVVVDVAPGKRPASRGVREVKPLYVLDRAAFFADEVVMLVEIRIKARCFAFACELTHQAGLGERAKIVIYGGAGGARIAMVDGAEDLLGSSVNRVTDEEVEYGVALCCGAQSGGLKGGCELGCYLRHSIILD